jgi:hypothetical protein
LGWQSDVLRLQVEQASLPLHSSSLVQQPAGASFAQVFVATLHSSTVHETSSTQSPSKRQQFALTVNTQEPASHASVVQGLPSLQSAALVQHPASAVTVHLPPLHASVVQAEVSAQSLSVTQQSDCGKARQVFVATLQTSAVHATSSSQSASLAQQLGIAV